MNEYYRLAKEKWDAVAKPLDGMGKFEGILCKIAAIEETTDIRIQKRAVLTLCGDHGVVAEGVTQTDQGVTASVAAHLARHTGNVCRMAETAGTQVIPVDMAIAKPLPEDIRLVESLREALEPGCILNASVAKGSSNFAIEPALNPVRMAVAMATGSKLVEACVAEGFTILGTGEMGIGNTTSSSALAACLLHKDALEVTGRGAGLSDEGLSHKVDVINRAIESHHLREEQDVQRILMCLGGYEIAGLVGVFLGGMKYRVPIVIDGLITAVAALIAERIKPGCKDFMLASHMGREKAMKLILEELGLEPVIQGDLALGEGTGAVMLFPLLDMAKAVYDGSTFSDIQVGQYRRFDHES